MEGYLLIGCDYDCKIGFIIPAKVVAELSQCGNEFLQSLLSLLLLLLVEVAAETAPVKHLLTPHEIPTQHLRAGGGCSDSMGGACLFCWGGCGDLERLQSNTQGNERQKAVGNLLR